MSQHCQIFHFHLFAFQDGQRECNHRLQWFWTSVMSLFVLCVFFLLVCSLFDQDIAFLSHVGPHIYCRDVK